MMLKLFRTSEPVVGSREHLSALPPGEMGRLAVSEGHISGSRFFDSFKRRFLAGFGAGPFGVALLDETFRESDGKGYRRLSIASITSPIPPSIWRDSAISARYALIYDEAGPIALIDFGRTWESKLGGPFVIEWDARGIARISDD